MKQKIHNHNTILSMMTQICSLLQSLLSGQVRSILLNKLNWYQCDGENIQWKKKNSNTEKCQVIKKKKLKCFAFLVSNLV